MRNVAGSKIMVRLVEGSCMAGFARTPLTVSLDAVSVEFAACKEISRPGESLQAS